MRVLLAVDGSEHSNRATEALRSLASVTSLTVLHVIDLRYPVLKRLDRAVSIKTIRLVDDDEMGNL